MDSNEYAELILVVTGRLREIGLEELADPELYTRQVAATGERHRLDSKKMLIEMLAAFGRHVATFDRQTLETALERINEISRGENLDDVEFVPTSEEGDSEPISLKNSPMLAELREDLDRLILDLRADDEQ